VVQSSRRRFDDIEMADEETGLRFPVAARCEGPGSSCDLRPRNDDILLSESSDAQTGGHGFGGRRDIADGVRGVDFDQLLGRSREPADSTLHGFAREATANSEVQYKVRTARFEWGA